MHILEKILDVHSYIYVGIFYATWKEDFYFSKKGVDHIFGREEKIKKEVIGQRGKMKKSH